MTSTLHTLYERHAPGSLKRRLDELRGTHLTDERRKKLARLLALSASAWRLLVAISSALFRLFFEELARRRGAAGRHALAPWTRGEVPPPVGPRQTDFSPGSGNALQSCVAVLLGVPLVDVPNFVTLECGYEQGIRAFVEPLSCQKVALGAAADPAALVGLSGAVVLLRGRSPRGAHGHVVLARATASEGVPPVFEMLFDPHPDDTFLADPTEEAFGWLMAIGAGAAPEAK
tara:strand:- start:508 stop:1200 length:693 start_codon:yes stop_codon:yes gene_type:complete